MYVLFLIVCTFVLGLYFYAWYGDGRIYEALSNMDGADEPRCPNILIQKGPKYYLYNSKLAPVPGVNPILFNDLEEYSEFLDWQRSVGIRCPVLYVQEQYDVHGNRVYRARPSVSEPEGGLPPMNSTQPNMPLRFQPSSEVKEDTYSKSSLPSSSVLGAMTPADTIKNSQEYMLFSDNAMDPNWGGPEYTRALVDSGYYQSGDQPAYTGTVTE